jgi:2-pyrone-4,6-dicarboxylate lactonase
VNRIPTGLEACDCHSHVYGPYWKFPLSESRVFDPPESPIQALEATWTACGISRAVLIQGSAYQYDNRALLDGISRDPENRRGIAIIKSSITDAELQELHRGGVRGIRFNWVGHLLQERNLSRSSALSEAALLAERISHLGWLVEIHVDSQDLNMVERLEVPSKQVVVIDHMARLDSSLGLFQPAFQRLLKLLKRQNIWVKVSGPDRLVRHESSLSAAMGFVCYLANEVPDRCVWGLDWPHVNLSRSYPDSSLRTFFDEAISDPELRLKILAENPTRLYGFASLEARKNMQGVVNV